MEKMGSSLGHKRTSGAERLTYIFVPGYNTTRTNLAGYNMPPPSYEMVAEGLES